MTPNKLPPLPEKFRKRPVVIEAMQVIATPWPEYVDAMHDFLATCQWHTDQDGIKIETLEGTMRASTGDWIIKGVQGEFYPCKPDIFAATYEPAEALRQSQSLPAGAVAGLPVAGYPPATIVGILTRILGDAEAGRVTGLGDTCEGALNDAITFIRDTAIQADAREKGEAVRAADAVFAFSAMLTSLPKVVPFGAAAWATPGVELAVAFMEANGLGNCAEDFPGALKFPAIEGKLLSVVEQAAAATQPAQASEKAGDVTAHAQRAFKNCIRELRHIQDEAKDYDFDEMTVQALQTGIESIELRLATSSQETASE